MHSGVVELVPLVLVQAGGDVVAAPQLTRVLVDSKKVILGGQDILRINLQN